MESLYQPQSSIKIKKKGFTYPVMQGFHILNFLSRVTLEWSSSLKYKKDYQVYAN